METRNQFKQQLSSLFRPSLFLRTSCSSTASSSIFASSATNTNSSSSLSTTTTTTTTNTDILIAHDSFSFSSRMMSLDCSSCKPTKDTEATDVVSVVEKINLKEKKERRAREIDEGKGRMCPPDSPLSPFNKDYAVDYYGFSANDVAKEEKVKTEKINVKQKKKNKKKIFLSNSYGFSSSSEFFSCDGAEENEEETARFFTSQIFTSDSSEFYQQPSSRNNKKKNNKKEMKKSSLRRPPRRRGTVRATYDHEGFRPVVSVTTKEEGKRDVDISGIPVMKRSSNPYVDFWNSMVEMIVERQIIGGKDLERLLHSYISLNSSHHHPFILRAFADISEVLFGH